jgi:hypothetical protein
MKVYLTFLSILFCGFFTFCQVDLQNDSLPKGWAEIPKTDISFKFGGYVKFDYIQDFNPIGSPYFFDVGTIPLDGGGGEQATLNARETRLHLAVKKQTSVGLVKAYIEGDFYGDGGAFRLRHAYVDINDKIRAGQYWSNFMDVDIIPKTLDFEKPTAYTFLRHALVRYKGKLTDHSYLSVAVEQGSATGQAPAQPGTFESPLPDLTLQYRLSNDWGHLQLSGYAGTIRYRYDAGGSDDFSVFGGNVSGAFKVLKLDRFTYQVIYGSGLGRYRGGVSTTLDDNGNIITIEELGFTLTYEHQWSDKFSSLLVYNQGNNLNQDKQTGLNIDLQRYVAANFLWHFTENAFTGIEYLYGQKHAIDGSNGQANRIQMSIKYAFN